MPNPRRMHRSDPGLARRALQPELRLSETFLQTRRPVSGRERHERQQPGARLEARPASGRGFRFVRELNPRRRLVPE